MTAISIIMPCYNRAYDLLRVLKRYDEQDVRETFELIAVDDASRDNTYEVLRSYQPQNYRLIVLRQERNTGPASARNRGIEFSQSPLIMFVGDDILPEIDFVRCHLEAHQQNPAVEVAILGQVQWGSDLPINTLMQHIDGDGAQQFSYYYFRDGREYDFRHLYTCNISLKRDLLLSEKQLFDPDFSGAGFEDAELGYRLAKRGVRIKYVAGILAYHYHYHTIWSFSNRQYLSGLSSEILLRKHPELRMHPSFRGHIRRLISMALQIPGVFTSEKKRDRLESLACHLASYYEWSPSPILSYLYIPVLNYFYYKGVFQSLFGNTWYSHWVHEAHARAYLLPAIKKFAVSAQVEELPLPVWFDGTNL